MWKTRSIDLSNYTPYLPWLLLVVWVLMQLGAYFVHGVQIVFDSHRYIDEANKLLTPERAGPLRLSYISYAATLALCIMIFGSAKSIVLLQLLVAGLSTIAFFKLALHLLGNRVLAFFATALLLLWPLYQHWNFYIHTESLFASLSIIAFLRVATATTKWQYLQLILLLLVITFLRANGFMVVLAVAGFGASAYWLKKGLSAKLLVLVLLLGGVVTTAVFALFFLHDLSGIHSFTGHLLSGNVIQGYDKISFSPQGNPVLSGSPLQQLGQLLWQEPVFFLQKSLGRVFFYWSQMRPYISFRYKVAIVVYLYPVYLLAAAALWKKQLPMPFVFALVILCTLFTAMVIVSGVDWDNRFMMPLLPYLFLCAAAGLKTLGTWHGEVFELGKRPL